MIVISGYSVTEELSDTPVFKWIRAEDVSGNKVILQIPNPDASWSTEQIQALKDYFLALQSIGGVDHIFPNQVLSDPDYQLIIQYPDKSYETLDTALVRAPENAEKWWRQACDALFRLHNNKDNKLEHGCVSLKSFVVVKNRAYLTNFGYAPLIKIGHAGALAEVGSTAAPEVSDPRHEVTKESDIYALAKAVAEWKPGFAETDIYKDATQDNSPDRCNDARKIYSGLKLYMRPRMFMVSTTAHPRAAGMVVGGGEYESGTEIQVEARPSDGWQFGHWTVDLGGRENPATVKVDRSKRIVAEFVKLPVTLRVEIKPRRSDGIVYLDDRTIDDEVTEIEFDKGQTVKVEAKSISEKWMFIGWQGDASGSDASVDIIMDANKVIVANFEKIRKGARKKAKKEPEAQTPIESYKLDVKVEPQGAGRIVSGPGRYQDGTDGKHSEATIEVKPKRGYRFAHWEGDIPAGDKSKNPVTLTMDGNKTVVAHFTKVRDSVVRVSADIEPPRAGSVDGAGEYPPGTTVTLEAHPASTSIMFGRWEGDVSGPENPIRVRAIRDVHVKACFIDSEEAAIKSKERLMIVGSPVTICPFLAFMTSLMTLWALGISITSGWFPFLCVSGLVVNSGVVLSRLILGSEKLRRIAMEELDEEDST